MKNENTLAALNAISKTVSSSLELNEVLDSTIEIVLEILDADSARIYLLNDKKDCLNLVAHRGLSEETTMLSHMKCRKVGDGLLGKTAINGKAKVVDNLPRANDPYVDSLFFNEGLLYSAYIPLVSKGNPVGMMCVSSRYKFKFSGDCVEFLTAVGNQIGIAVDNANLYENLKLAYNELKEAQEQVIRTEKMASLGKLAATIAHEINNPLAAVLTYIKLLIKLITLGRFTPERMEDISRYLNTMESETARCGEIVKNLLAFSRQSKITIKPYSIEEIIDRSMILIAHDLELKDIRIVKEIESDIPLIQCDFRQIQQTLLNLMGNASEAMTGGGTLTVTAKHSEKGDFLEILISDTGCGISEENLKNIFEPFFTTKEEGKGVGLGLSVVYGIISKHNGSVRVESEPGKGSTFKVCLPVHSHQVCPDHKTKEGINNGKKTSYSCG
ncbi:ATP-binding protein [Desulfococcaceae bacterium HSG8]|nr:ATP-binding protein [Desulfococcaceae bacterium HSG8]